MARMGWPGRALVVQDASLSSDMSRAPVPRVPPLTPPGGEGVGGQGPGPGRGSDPDWTLGKGLTAGTDRQIGDDRVGTGRDSGPMGPRTVPL
eukprot:scaffold1328_cov394-Prasinococcus_capsulatus_cf.AAC.30